jgi:hypothetical protein
MGNAIRRRMLLTPLKVAMIAVNAALYAGVGIMTYFGIFAPPPIGVVRFWPVVIIPGVFAALFGPWVGGIGAAIGIFASDMVSHGNPLLSMTVGVPSNFIGFFILGYLAQKKMDLKRLTPVLVIGLLTLIAGIYSIASYLPETFAFTGLSPTDSALLFLTAVGGSYVLIIIITLLWPEWKSYGVASIIGLGIGSAIIGIGLWAYSQLFEWFGPSNAPFYFSLLWFIWTFTTEIPFLLILGPPILKVCYRAFPSLAPSHTE